jgi:hypothetical protein
VAISVVDTAEIRWFVSGPLAVDVRRWFAGSTGVVEERSDTYRVEDRVDEGVKYRGGQTLELKVRRRIGQWTDLGCGLAGSPEVWRKWTPADGLVDVSGAVQWVEVHKVIVKRRFLLDGTEVAFSTDPIRGAGCDIEVADIRIGAVATWTFAFATFGPDSTQRTALVESWRGLRVGAPGPASFELDAGSAMGYPEWLARTMDGTADVRARETQREQCEL